MTEKEMLQEANKWLSFIANLEVGMNDHLKAQRQQVLSWLIQQAERVQELVKANKTLSDNHFQQIEQHKYLIQQNKRYREVIDSMRLHAHYPELIKQIYEALEESG